MFKINSNYYVFIMLLLFDGLYIINNNKNSQVSITFEPFNICTIVNTYTQRDKCVFKILTSVLLFINYFL